MKKITIWRSYLLPLLTLVFVLCSCSAEMANSAAESVNEDDEFAKVEAEDISQSPTRALAMDLTSFSISVLNVKANGLLADKVQYTMTDAGLTYSKAWRMSTGEMKAIGVSPTMDILENVTLSPTDHYFDYTVPTTEQSMLKIGSLMSFTKKSTNNVLQMKFVNALSLLTFRARNELKMEDDDGNEFDVKIYVKSITLHNLASKGRFTFTGDYKGTWVPIDGNYANYTQVLKTPVELTTTTYTNVMDSLFVFLPQSPENNAWAPQGIDNAPAEDAISMADADHKCYIELRCAITTERNNQTIYVWGSADDYQPIYFPYIKKNCPKVWNLINRQAVYNLSILKTVALDSQGRPIKPQAQSDEYGQFENAVFVEVTPTDADNNDNVDDWPDADLIDVVI